MKGKKKKMKCRARVTKLKKKVDFHGFERSMMEMNILETRIGYCYSSCV